MCARHWWRSHCYCGGLQVSRVSEVRGVCVLRWKSYNCRMILELSRLLLQPVWNSRSYRQEFGGPFTWLFGYHHDPGCQWLHWHKGECILLIALSFVLFIVVDNNICDFLGRDEAMINCYSCFQSWNALKSIAEHKWVISLEMFGNNENMVLVPLM